MSEMITWLRQQLDTDEQGIRQAIRTEEWGVGEHDLRTVQAHRAILDEHPASQGWSQDAEGRLTSGPICRTCAGTDCCGDYEGDAYPCKTLRALVSIYSDRDGYNSDWSA